MIKPRVFRRTDSRLFAIALQLVEYVNEIKKPDGERMPQGSTMQICNR